MLCLVQLLSVLFVYGRVDHWRWTLTLCKCKTSMAAMEEEKKKHTHTIINMKCNCCLPKMEINFNRFFLLFFYFLVRAILVIIHNKSMSASHSYTEGCSVQRFEDHGRFHVLRWGECVAGTIATHFEDGRNAENQRTRRNARSSVTDQIRQQVVRSNGTHHTE